MFQSTSPGTCRRLLEKKAEWCGSLWRPRYPTASRASFFPAADETHGKTKSASIGGVDFFHGFFTACFFSGHRHFDRLLAGCPEPARFLGRRFVVPAVGAGGQYRGFLWNRI